MTCQHCFPTDKRPIELPFRALRTVADDSHEIVGLASCEHCGQLALHFGVDVYDDCWRYWCPIDDQELARLSEPDGEDEPKVYDTARSIIRDHTVLQDHPVHGLGWVPGTGCVLDGPPW